MRYYGGKGKLVDFIFETAKEFSGKEKPDVFDLFSGTSVVARHFKKNGSKVYTNDILVFSQYRSVAYIELNQVPQFELLRNKINTHPIKYLNELKGRSGFITTHYSPYKTNSRQYVSVENAQKIDVIREQIEEWYDAGSINFQEFCYLITCLLEGINLISNVTGTYAAFLKSWDRRALNKLVLTDLDINNNMQQNKAFNEDANKFSMPINLDICYLDPPYNGRQYTSNYFFLELIATGWFKNNYNPSGVTGMIKFDDKKSDYCSKVKARKAFQDLLLKIESPMIMLSYNNEGIIPHDDLIEDLSRHGKVREVNRQHKRYRAINQDGSVTKTKESIFILQR